MFRVTCVYTCNIYKVNLRNFDINISTWMYDISLTSNIYYRVNLHIIFNCIIVTMNDTNIKF